MSLRTKSETRGVELAALTRDGLCLLEVPAGGGNIHELLEVLPGGVYSALRTFGRERFLMLDAHFDRTDRSMAALGWTKRLDRAALRRALHARVSVYPLPEARVRFDVLPEPFELQGVSSDVFVAISPHEDVPREFMEQGVRIEVASHLSRPTPRIKTTGFVRARKPLPLSLQSNYEGLLIDREQRVLECSSANIGFACGGRWVAAGDGVLEGITMLALRRVAPTLPGGLAMEFEDRRLPLSELARVDEAFLSSSARGVVPIVQIGDTPIGNGKVGPRVRALVDAYYALAEREARRAID